MKNKGVLDFFLYYQPLTCKFHVTLQNKEPYVEVISLLLQILGNALGIPENSVRTYTEAEIRAGYVDIFPLILSSRLFCCLRAIPFTLVAFDANI